MVWYADAGQSIDCRRHSGVFSKLVQLQVILYLKQAELSLCQVVDRMSSRTRVECALRRRKCRSVRLPPFSTLNISSSANWCLGVDYEESK